MKYKNLFLGRAIVRDNAALIGKKTLVSIIEIMPVSMSDLEENEKQELALQYQYFLRSLAYSIQIVLRFVNKDSEKYLHRKRLADVEESIKKIYKKNFKEVLAENDSFKEWLKHFIELNVRPMLLCYVVIPVMSETNLARNEIAYIEALQLLNQRTSDCISKLSLIKARKKIKPNGARCEWEEQQLGKIQEKKALIALRMFSQNGAYYSFDTLIPVKNGKNKVNDYAKNNFYDEIIAEREILLQLKRLDDIQISNLFDSYCKDFVVLNANGQRKYVTMKDLFGIRANHEKEGEK